MTVYQIINEVTLDRYVGSTMKKFKDRVLGHQSRLRCKNHHLKKMQELHDTYGMESFSFEAIEQYANKDVEFIRTREQFYIDTLKPNLNRSKSAFSTKGIKVSDEQKERVSKRLKEMYRTGEIKMPEGHFEKLSKLYRGQKTPTERIQKAARARQRDPLYVYDRYTLKFIGTFLSRYDLMKELNISNQQIDNAFRFSLGTTGLYIIKNKKEHPLKAFIDYNREIKPNSNKPKCVGVYDMEENILRAYKSLMECARHEKISRNTFLRKGANRVIVNDNIIKIIE